MKNLLISWRGQLLKGSNVEELNWWRTDVMCSKMKWWIDEELKIQRIKELKNGYGEELKCWSSEIWRIEELKY